MNKFTKPEIPEVHLEFAKKVAALAVELGVQKVDLSYLPHWGTEPAYHDNISGKISVNIKTTDGRGRPKVRVTISLDAHLELDL